MCVCVCAKLLQSCLTLCNPVDHSRPGSSVHGILQARILEWVAISFSLHMWNLILKIKLQMNLFTKQKQNYRYGEQICDYQRRNVGGAVEGINQELGMNTYYYVYDR